MHRSIRAMVVDPAADYRLSLTQVAAPQPAADEALVRVKAVSLNLGEVRGALTGARAGHRPGWDLAGVVERAAASGQGPAAGSRVVGLLGSGAWAELAAVPVERLAELPADVGFGDAATLPVAGLTALHAVERAKRLLGNRALVTGANGGVGLFALQLARLCGAQVFGLLRNPDYQSLVAATGATPLVSDAADIARQHAPFQLVAESVGGDILPAVVSMLGPDGVVVSYGGSAGTRVTLDNVYQLGRSPRGSLYGLILFNEFVREPAAAGLARLARLVAAGSLQTNITVEADFEDLPQIAQALYDRKIAGKAVLHLA